MVKLILLRHGQSLWNQKNLFSGWVDVSLSGEGVQEAIRAGQQFKDEPVDIIYTSGLIRAQTTLFVAMAQHTSGKAPCVRHSEGESLWYERGVEENRQDLIPTYLCPELNERIYGDLQGKNKQQIAQQYGEETMRLWRRSFKTAPPGGESLKDVVHRVLPFFRQRIITSLDAGQNVLVCAHGNVLRAIVMQIESLSEDAVLHLEIATGACLSYEYQGNGRFSS